MMTGSLEEWAGGGKEARGLLGTGAARGSFSGSFVGGLAWTGTEALLWLFVEWPRLLPFRGLLTECP